MPSVVAAAQERFVGENTTEIIFIGRLNFFPLLIKLIIKFLIILFLLILKTDFLGLFLSKGQG